MLFLQPVPVRERFWVRHWDKKQLAIAPEYRNKILNLIIPVKIS
jgi:hypothetical protein